MMRAKRTWVVVVLGGLLAGASLLQAAGPQRLTGHVPKLVHQLAAIGRPAPTNELHLALSLPLRHQAELEQLLQQLYDPASPNYRHFLGASEFARRFGPSPEDYAAVTAYCRQHGLRVVGTHPNRTVLEVSGPVRAAEAAFRTSLRLYRDPRRNRIFYAPESEPALDLSVPVLHIYGLDNLNPPQALVRPRPAGKAAPSDGSGVGGAFLGNDFRAAYAPGVNLTGTGQNLALVEFDGYYAKDITSYEQLAGLPAVPLQKVLINGFSGIPSGGISSGNTEVALDIEMAISMAPGLNKVMVYETAPRTAAISVLNRIATDNSARQISCSWTWGAYDLGTDQVFEQMAAQGQSFFQASGDSGAYSGPIDAPADNPYITVVGGTTLSTTQSGAWVGETAWNDGYGDATGGGVSTRYLLPAWQQGISMAANLGSTLYRNIPDVAMVADNILSTGNNGETNVLVGTSVGAPLWAGFVAMANEQATLNGQPSIGFVNPALYALGQGPHYLEAFHDVTGGDNAPDLSTPGFPAVANYDLSTGWGTPTGNSTLELLLGSANNQIDHFAWVPLEEAVPTNAPFPVTLLALTADNTLASGFNGTATLTAWETQTNTIFSREFESGSLSDWDKGVAPYTASIDNTTGAAGTAQSLKLSGGDTNDSYNAISHSLPNLQPDVFEFYVKASAAGVTGGYVVAGAAAYRTNAVFHFRMDASGLMGMTDQAGNFYGTPFVPNRWYKIDLHLDWSAHLLDYYANDSLVMARIPFCNPNLNSLAVVFLYNFDTTQVWYDQFSLLQSASSPVALTPGSAEPFTQGLWNGLLTLGAGGTNLSLLASDGAGHTGLSLAFAPGQKAAAAAPQIVAQPADQTVGVGDEASFNVIAGGSPTLQYQWYSSIGGQSKKLAGKTEPALVLGPTSTSMSGGYYVVVGNEVAPPNTVTSRVAQLTVGIFETPLSLQINGLGNVSPTYTGQPLQVGKKYTFTAKPGSGYVFSGWSGSLTSNLPKLSFTMRSNLVLQVSFSPNPFGPLAGTYQGLFYDTNGLVAQSAGFVSAVLSSRGTFSAQLRLGAKNYRFSGLLLGNDGTFSGPIARTTNAPLVALQLDLSGLSGLTGQVSSQPWQAQLLALRAPYKAPSNAFPQPGKYTLLLPGADEPSGAPGGDGYATLNVSSSGGLRCVGALADGTRFSQSAFLAQGGVWPFFASAYSGSGLVMGWLTVTNDTASDIDGDFAWLKPPGEAIDPDGLTFTNIVLGSQYLLASHSALLDFGTGQVALASVELPQDFTNTVWLEPNNKLLNLSTTNPLSLSFSAGSGLFRGRVTDPDTQAQIPVTGVVLRRQNFGAGFFLGTQHTGRVLLQPAP